MFGRPFPAIGVGAPFDSSFSPHSSTMSSTCLLFDYHLKPWVFLLIVLPRWLPSITSSPYAVIQGCSSTTRDKVVSVAQSRARGSPKRPSSGRQQPACFPLVNVSATSLLRHLLDSRVPYHAFTHWRDDHNSPAAFRMKERYSDVVSSGQTIMLAPRIGSRCGLTHDDPGNLYWWCRLRQTFAGVRVDLCRNQSAPDRIWVFQRPFRIVQPLPGDGMGSATSSFSMFASSLSRPSYTFFVISRVPLLAP